MQISKCWFCHGVHVWVIHGTIETSLLLRSKVSWLGDLPQLHLLKLTHLLPVSSDSSPGVHLIGPISCIPLPCVPAFWYTSKLAEVRLLNRHSFGLLSGNSGLLAMANTVSPGIPGATLPYSAASLIFLLCFCSNRLREKLADPLHKHLLQ